MIEKNRLDLLGSNMDSCYYTMAKRANNPKRNFLFVSKLIGKHIPINPDIIMATGYILAYEMNKKNKNHFTGIQHLLYNDCILYLKEYDKLSKNFIISLLNKFNNVEKFDGSKSLFIGFAETATGLGMATAFFFNNGYYVSTTRELLDDYNILFSFEEEHSHATTHKCYLNLHDNSIDFKIENIEKIILIDDEITTGKTLLNMIAKLIKNTHIKDYDILTILDWRTDELINSFKNFQNENNINNLNVVCMRSASYKNEDLSVYEEIEKFGSFDFVENNDAYYCDFKLPKIKNSNYEFFKLSGRVLMKTNDLIFIENNIKDNIHILQKELMNTLNTDCEIEKNKFNILVLGHGENIYIPSRIAAYLNTNENFKVEFKTTTRSPIYCDNKLIKTKYKFYDKYGNPYFFYNKEEIESKYNLVLFISETSNIEILEIPKLTNNLKVLFL